MEPLFDRCYSPLCRSVIWRREGTLKGRRHKDGDMRYYCDEQCVRETRIFKTVEKKIIMERKQEKKHRGEYSKDSNSYGKYLDRCSNPLCSRIMYRMEGMYLPFKAKCCDEQCVEEARGYALQMKAKHKTPGIEKAEKISKEVADIKRICNPKRYPHKDYPHVILTI